VEIAVTQTMVDRVERRFDLRPRRLAGDTGYGAVRLIKWLVDRNITPHVPVWDKSARPDGTFSRADFVFDQEHNIYVCPGGAELTSTGNIDQGHIVYYRASKSDCSQCSLKPKCTTAVVRKITRDLNEDVRDRVRALANTEAFQQSRRERKKIEMRFAHMKRILRLDRLRLRGLGGARDEVLLTATAQNLRRLAKLLCRAPPPLELLASHRHPRIGTPADTSEGANEGPAKIHNQALQSRPAEFCNTIGAKADFAVTSVEVRVGPNSDIGVIRRHTRFVRLAAGVSELTITPEALLCGDPWRTWRGPPLGEMVLNR
jgi:Transposase DDE domain